MAIFLHQLAERYQVLGRSGQRFMIPMSREDIGSYLGLVIETVSRTLNAFVREGLIEPMDRIGRAYRIIDAERLSSPKD